VPLEDGCRAGMTEDEGPAVVPDNEPRSRQIPPARANFSMLIVSQSKRLTARS
jgi:hypothetical protein